MLVHDNYSKVLVQSSMLSSIFVMLVVILQSSLSFETQKNKCFGLFSLCLSFGPP